MAPRISRVRSEDISIEPSVTEEVDPADDTIENPPPVISNESNKLTNESMNNNTKR